MENITKLEYFAAKAMQGLLSNDEHIKDESSYPEITADMAVQYATALLSALEKLTEQPSNYNKPAVINNEVAACGDCYYAGDCDSAALNERCKNFMANI